MPHGQKQCPICRKLVKGCRTRNCPHCNANFFPLPAEAYKVANEIRKDNSTQRKIIPGMIELLKANGVTFAEVCSYWGVEPKQFDGNTYFFKLPNELKAAA